MSDLGVYRDDSLINETDGPLFFGAAEKFVKSVTAHPDMRFLILRMRRVPMIDTTGVVALQTINQQLERQGCQLLISGLQPELIKHLQATGFLTELGEDNIFEWTRDAMIAAQGRLSLPKAG